MLGKQRHQYTTRSPRLANKPHRGHALAFKPGRAVFALPLPWLPLHPP